MPSTPSPPRTRPSSSPPTSRSKRPRPSRSSRPPPPSRSSAGMPPRPPGPPPHPPPPPEPLIVYGASSALGLFTVKLARLANIHPIIAIGGASHPHLLPLLDQSRGDAFVNYGDGVESMAQQVRHALGPLQARHALDAISSGGTWVSSLHPFPPQSGFSLVGFGVRTN